MHALVPPDQFDTSVLLSRQRLLSEDNIRYTPRDFIQDITYLYDFSNSDTSDLKIVQLCHGYPLFEDTFPAWFNYKSRKQSKGNIEKYGLQLIKQLYFFKHLGMYIFNLKSIKCIIDVYMKLSELDQKIDQSKRKNTEYRVRKIVSDINYFYNVINQEYQRYIKNLIAPINPSKSRSNMMEMESFFKNLGHLKQTSKTIRDIVIANYPITNDIETSLAKFIQTPQKSKELKELKDDHRMVFHLVSQLSIYIAK